MKRISLLSLLLLMVLTTFAQTRSAEEAIGEARAFLGSASDGARKAKMNMNIDLRYTLQRPDSSNPAAYLFQVGEDDGYVLVSAEASARTILAYADDGRIVPDSIPENMQIWLLHYAEEIAWASSHATLHNANGTHKAKALAGARIEPLLGNTAWNQGAPYYNNCPIDSDGKRSYTGCVATATAQIMRYWETPTVGEGSHSYSWTRTNGTKRTLSADFSQSTYDWQHMIGNYNYGYSNAEAEAVAKLMSDVGIAVDMQYSSNGSGTLTELAAQALYTYFGYDASMRAVRPDFVGNDAFAEQMLNELLAERPVLMAGATTKKEGHSFVCDGFDGDGFFHINWGWGGSQNGFFALSALDPGEQGMGGAASGEGFSVSVLGVMGIRPNEGGEKSLPRMGTLSQELVTNAVTTRNTKVTIRISQIRNTGLESWQGGAFGYAVLNKDREFVCWHEAWGFDGLPVGSFYPSEYEFTSDLSDVPSDGDYTLTLIYTDAALSQWWPADVGYDSPAEFPFTVSGNTVTFNIYSEDDGKDYTIRNLQTSVQGSTVFLGFESDAPYFDVQLYNKERTYAKGVVNIKNVKIYDVPDGEWTLSVRPLDEQKNRYLADAVTTTVKVGTPQEITLVLNVNDEQMGTVTGAGVYHSGDEVLIEAKANEGYEFVNWSDGNTNATRTITLEKTGSSPRTVTLTANFQKSIDYTIYNLTATSEGNIIHLEFESEAPFFHVKVYNDKTNHASGILDYKTVQVKNVPDGEWTVWVRPVDATKNYYMGEAVTTTVIVDTREEITLVLNVNDELMGTVTGAGTYYEGETAHVSAVANEGYHFVKWDDDVELPERDILFEKTGEPQRTLTLTAIFEANPEDGILDLQSTTPNTIKYLDRGKVFIQNPRHLYNTTGQAME